MVAGGDDGLSLRRVGLQWLRRQWLKNRCHASSFSLSANGGFRTKERRALSVMYNSPFILPYVYSFIMVFLSVELLPPVSSRKILSGIYYLCNAAGQNKNVDKLLMMKRKLLFF
jgi:hypothetical protein